MHEIILPRLDPGMKEGTIIEWYKKEGEYIEKGESIVKIEGEKVIFDVEVPESGIIGRILVNEGVSLPIGTQIAIIVQPGEEIPEIEFEITRPEVVETIPEEFFEPVLKRVKERIRASPLARRIAKEKNIDLGQIKGSGPGGRIEKKDVLKYIEYSSKETKPISLLETRETIVLAGMRKTIADRMTDSYRKIPQLAIAMEANMSEILNFKDKIEKKSETKIPLTTFLTKVVALALEKFPIVNSTLDEGKIKIFKDINIGVAVAVEEGLIVPVIRNANKKSIIEIASMLKDLVEKTRDRIISTDELRGGTFTITNLGAFGVNLFAPIINPPQAAILGIGKITKKPRVIEEKIIILPVIMLTLVFDHRIIDGSKAAIFLNEIKKLIEDPYCLSHAREAVL